MLKEIDQLLVKFLKFNPIRRFFFIFMFPAAIAILPAFGVLGVTLWLDANRTAGLAVAALVFVAIYVFYAVYIYRHGLHAGQVRWDKY